MRNKGAIIFLTSVITLLCIYYLSFTWVSRSIRQDATEFATNEEGRIDLIKRQSYLDSIWNKPVYDLFGMEFTYKEIKETELNLGLDLQGGMHVTLEVSQPDILKELVTNPEDATFQRALDRARELQRNSQSAFVDLFFEAYAEQNPDAELNRLFASAATRGDIQVNSTNEEVIAVVKQKVDEAIQSSFTILRTRVDKFGTSQPNIQRVPGTGRIQVELPGVENPERVRKLLQGVAKLEFWEVAETDEVYPSLIAINQLLTEEAQQKMDTSTTEATDPSAPSDQGLGGLVVEEEVVEVAPQDTLQPEIPVDTGVEEGPTSLERELAEASGDTSALDSLNRPAVDDFLTLNFNQNSLSPMLYRVEDTARINRLMKREDVEALMPSNIKLLWSALPSDATIEGTQLFELYPVRLGRGKKPAISGDVIRDARQDFNPDTGEPEVEMVMNVSGAKKWKQITAEAAQKTPKGRIAIVLDNGVYSAPVVQTEIPNGISSISGNFTVEAAKDLASVLKAGALPAPTRIVEEAVVGATLGKVAQREGIQSMLVGLLLVIIFMVFYYARGGFVADVALFFNIFFILGILAQLSAALTLPGIAGIVLTIGMSIDANVLIFERIREELRHGAGLKQAISSGYQKAFSSIIDANVTTLLTAVILYVLGQGPIKGFAITLMIGIFCSFFAAVFITRVIVDWMAKKGEKSKLDFSNKFSRNWLAHINWDFMTKRKLMYVVSSLIIIAGLAAIFAQGGLNLGVDFKGGRSYIVEFPTPVTPTEIRNELVGKFENAGSEVKTYGANNVLKVTTSYLVDNETEEADEQVQSNVINALEEATGLNYVDQTQKLTDADFTISGSSKVGATIADDIKDAAFEAGIISIIAIFLYILIRFRKWQFSVGAIVALIHDTLMVFAFFGFAGLLGIRYEIDQVFVAAILTIIGYSINDTVVVFDRIRETLGIKTGSDLKDIYNESINNTLNRTLITSVTTLVVVLILFIFGGETLQGFSYALLVGILVGTYSSVFIASPISLDLLKQKS